MDWINLARGTNDKIVWKLGFPKMRGNSWVAEENNRPKFYARRIWAQFKFGLQNFCLLSSHLKKRILKYTKYAASTYHEIFITTEFNKSSRATATPGWSIKVFFFPFVGVWNLASPIR